MTDTVVVTFGDLGKGESKNVIAGPGTKIVFKDIEFKDASVDIVDADVIVSDKDGRKVIFPGMALLMFEEELAPKIFFDDDLIQPNQFLSKVGEIGNLSVQDFIAISSILRETLEQQQQESQAQQEAEAESEDQASAAETVAVMQAIKEAQQMQQAAQQQTSIDEKKNDNKKSSVDEEGVFIEPRPPIVQNAANSGISFNVDEAPETPEQKPLFEIRLLQPGRVNDVTEDGIPFVRGGGGSEASVFDPNNASQFSIETLNLATATENLIVEADNSDLFTETLMTRVIELQPILPAGFKPSRLLIEGFPDGFVVDGADRVSGGWELLNPDLDERGNIRVNVSYPVPSDDDFTLRIKLEANFDPTAKDENGQPLPLPLQQFMETEGEQKATVRNVFSAEDLNFIDQEGDLVWVFANNPNGNRIFTGSGADTVTGGVASDAIDGGDGNDLLYGMRGDDTLTGGRGNDTMLGGPGSDLLEGGAGSDTADYSAFTVTIEADLLDGSSGAAYVTIDRGGNQFEEDRLRQVENLLAGSADDTLIGDDADNLLHGGGGSDTLVGHGGNDSLVGGAGIDTVDYSASASAVDADLRLAENNVVIDAGNQDTVREVEIFIATDFDDRIIGSDDNDTLLGGGGDDRISGGRGNDHLDGGVGANDYADFADANTGVVLNLGEAPDPAGYTTALIGSEVDRLRNFEHVTGSEFGDNITGSDAGEILQGAGGDDIVNGAGGSDTLDGGAGADALNGDAGNDTILVSRGNDRIDGGAGLDTYDFTGFGDATSIFANLAGAADGSVAIRGADDQTVRNLENIIATAGDDTIYGDVNDNLFQGLEGDDTLAGGGGDDTLDGGDGRDTADYSRVTSGINLDLSLGVVNDDGQGGRDVILDIEDLTGSDFDDVLVGDRGVNVLRGSAGDDTLQGRGGDDTLEGGAGSDTASYSQSPLIGVNISLATGAIINDGEGGQDTFIGIENLEGSLYGDVLTGDDQGNTLSGIGGNDTLDGALGNDVLRGGTGDDRLLSSLGADVFDGGEGSDTADYAALGAANAISVTLAAGFDATVTINGQDNDTLRFVENVSGTAGDDVIRGDLSQNTLLGNAGNDLVSGGAGADFLDGGAGFDQLRFDDLAGFGVVVDIANRTALFRGDSSIDSFQNFEIYLGSLQADEFMSSDAADTVDGFAGNDTFFGGAGADDFDGNAGLDTVDYSQHATANFIDVTLDGANPVFVTVDGSDNTLIRRIENVTGSAGNDRITGDSLNNVLKGHLGNDTLDGGDGNDSLYGETGADLLIAGLGDDLFDGGTGSDTLDYSGVANSINVDLAAGEAMADGDGGVDTIVSVENIRGTGLNDIITGSSASNTLQGFGGNDVIRGGTGSDALDGGAGTADAVRFDDLLDGGVVLDIGNATAAYATDGSTDTLAGFELYFATNQGDTIIGSTGADTAFGLGGTDTFVATAGGDTFDGGLGRDVIDYTTRGAGFVVVTLNAENDATVTVNGGDNDIVRNIEGVIGTSGSDTLTGDALDNSLVGAGGNDVIRGGRGSDFLDGGLGVDQLRFDELTVLGIELNLATGTATFGGDGSTDTFTGFEEYYTSNQADLIFGSAVADVVFGLNGADTFNASAGLDTLDGGLGNDLIDYANLAGINRVTVTLNGATATTVTVDGGDDTSIRNIENVRGTGGADTLTGDDEDNTLYGVGGDDLLTGAIGDDTLDGGQGNDFLRGGEGNDALLGGSGIDTADYTLAAGGVTANMQSGVVATDGDGGTDTLSGIENLLGSANIDNLTGNSSVNTIDGAGGNDTIRGGLGSDRLLGGAGTGDVAAFDDLGAGVVLNLGTSTATSLSDSSVDTFTGFESYLASGFVDTLIGSTAADVVNLLGGNDSINASGGVDSIDGGADIDTIDYSALSGVTAIDVTLNGAIDATVTVTGGDNDLIRNIENVIGSTGGDRIQGDSNDNYLQGREGADRLVASRGIDTLDGGDGIDTADYEVPAAASAIAVTLVDSGDSVVTVTGGDNNLLRNIENLIGTAGRDVLTGNNQANVLAGRGDNDTLNGGGGNDTLQGEAGNDLFLASAGNDLYDGGLDTDTLNYSGLAGTSGVRFVLSGGTDAQVTVTGGDNDTVRDVENVVGTGFADDMTGDVFDNLFEGLGGNDRFGASGGADTLDGGSGVDTVDYSLLAGVLSVTVTLSAGSNATVVVVGGTNDVVRNIENVTGSGGADVLTGDALTNVLRGEGGNDTLAGRGGLDTLIGGGGVDTADYANAGSAVVADLEAQLASADGDGAADSLLQIENLRGSAFADTLRGGTDGNFVEGLGGNDRLVASAGTDTLDGGTEVDTVDYSTLAGVTSIQLSLNGSIDATVTVNGGDNDFVRNVENVIGTSGADRIQGDGGVNLLEGRGGNDTLVASRGVDTLDGGLGSDTADFEVPAAASAVTVVLADSGDTTATLTGGDNSVLRDIENIVGTAGRDTITGNNSANILFGRADNDTLNGGGGNDTLFGESGIDLFVASAGNDTYDGGTETDTLNYSGLAGTAGITFTLAGGSDATVTVAGGDNDTVRNVENVVGTAATDDMTGDGEDNVLEGLGGADRFGASAGSDTIDGGTGIDTVDYSQLAGVLSVAVTLNTSTNATVTVVGGSNDLVRNIENVTGTGGADTLVGDTLTNILSGGDGNDTLSGRGGLDTLVGGADTDTANYSAAGSGVTANLEIELAAVDGDGASDVLLQMENLRGSAFADTLRGGTGVNFIEGGSGDDRLVASAGSDTYDGGADIDTIDYSTLTGITSVDVTLNGSINASVVVVGGQNDVVRNIENVVGSVGNDLITGDLNDNRLEGFDGNDRLRGRAGNDILDGGDGTDTADYSAALSAVIADLGANASVQDGDGGVDTFLNIENLTGSNLGDTLIGSSGNNVIDGNGGDDTLMGRGGIDTLDGNAGTNTASYANAGGLALVDLEAGVASNDGDGSNDVLLNIQNVQGSAFNDTILGSAGDNLLAGLAGNDVLRGRGGSDVLDGGANTDTADYAQAGSGINANLLLNVAANDGDGGSDTFISIENISGSAFNDRIEGNNAANVLSGQAGNDRLLGNAGADTLDGGADTDVADYSTAAGAVDVDLANNTAANDGSGSVDTLISIEDLTGSDFDDLLQGNGGANRIDGGVGNDTLAGRGGNDSLVGGADEDTADYRLAGAGTNVNLQTGAATDDGEGGADTLSSIEHLLGSAFADVLRGSNSNNSLEGNAGNDTLSGGAGADVLDGGADIDTANYETAGGSVSVNLASNLAAVDGDGSTDTLLSIENVRGSLNADTLVGDGNGNVLDGMGGNDVLQGQGGIDTLIGNAGNDTVSYSLATAGVVVDLGNNVTSDDGQGASDVLDQIENAEGSNQVDTLLGSSGANILSGGQDNDTLVGRGGVDTLDGGAGVDTADYTGAANAVIVDLSLTQAANDGDGSADALISIENVNGSGGADQLTGDAFGNRLDGGGGNDTIAGRGGADILIGGGGIDLADYAQAANGIVVDLGVGVASNDGDSATDTLTDFENLRGSENADQITGSGQANLLLGLGGNDTFFASAGLDTVDGGLGNDTVSFALLAGVTGISVQLNGGIDATIDVTGSDDTIVRNVENVVGSGGADVLRGDALVNTLDGGAGNDTVFGGAGGDQLIGGADSDQLRFDDLSGAGVTLNLQSATAIFGGDGSTDSFSGFERYFLSNQNDVLVGSTGADTVDGLGADDTFNASAGNDTFDGGAGLDTVTYAALGINFITVTLNGAGNATVTVNGGDNDVIANIENVIGSAGNDVITGDGLDNVLNGSAGADTLNGGGGADSLVGGTGNDLLLGSDGSDTFDGSADVDTLDYSGQAGVTAVAVTLSGGTFASVTVSGSDNDLVANVENVIGSGGADILAGDNLVNVLTGGAGNDTLSGHAGADTLIGGADTDTVDYSTQTGINFISLTLNGGANATVTVDGDANDTIREIENVIGSTGNDLIIGDGLGNTIDGFQGNDTIVGGAGADLLIGGQGIDTLDYSLQAGITSVIVDLDGANTMTAVVNGDVNDQVRDIENVIGTGGADVLDGDNNTNLLFGMGGDDTIRPEGGNDTLDGGTGTNTLAYNDLNSPVVVDMGDVSGGYFSVSVAGFTQLATGFQNLTGSINNDTITGDGGVNVLVGDRGRDTIDGGAGNDSVYGGDDEDTLSGGLGDDLLDGGANDDILRADAGADTFDGGAGVNDLLDYSLQTGITAVAVTLNGSTNATVTVTGDVNDLVRNVENIIGTAGNDTLTGDAFDNEFYAGEGNDTLNGGDGTDYLDGGANDDLFFGSAGVDTYEGGSGIDTVDFSTQAGINFIQVTLSGSAFAAITIDGEDDDLSRNVENVIGTSGNDSIWGDSAINILRGGDGFDELAGRGGNDTLDGQGGVDRARYYEAASGVVVDLSLGQATNDGDGGVDTLISIQDVWGSTFADTLIGDDNDNSIHGWEGNDTLRGNGGADILNGWTGIDWVDYNDQAGVTSIAVTLNGSTAVTVTVNGGANDTILGIENVIGTDGNDVITGDTQANTLLGGDGDDTLNGWTGNDRLDGGAGINTLSYSGRGGSLIATLAESGTYTVTIGGETDTVNSFQNVIGTSGSDTITGNSLDNILNGGDQNDILRGGAGNDTLIGGNLDDTLRADAGNDTYDGGSGYDYMDYRTQTGVGRIEVTMTGSGNFTTGVFDGGGVLIETDTGIAIDYLFGTSGNDTFVGDASGIDFSGEDGDDTFRLTTGSSTVSGGAGIDTLDYSNAAGGVSVNMNTLFFGSFQVSDGGGGTDLVVGTERFIGSNSGDAIYGDANNIYIEGRNGNDDLRLNAANGTVLGGEGDDYIEANAANAVVTGDDGNDSILVRGQTVNINAGAGNDGVTIDDGALGNGQVFDGGADTDTVSYAAVDSAITTLVVALQNAGDTTVTLNGSITNTIRNFENFAGSNGSDTITGDSGLNILSGVGGNDTIIASLGGDTLDGGTGTDTANFSGIGATSIAVVLNAGSLATVTVNGGTNQQIQNIENIVATSGGDTLTGDSGVNVLDGGAGNDTIIGSLGNDNLIGGADTDLLRYDQIAGMGVQLNLTSNLAIGGANAFIQSFSGFEQYITTNQADTITGATGAESVTGAAGNDTFFASAGADSLDGGADLDVIDYSGLSGVTGISVTLNGATAVTVTVTGGQNDTIVNFETLIGSSGDDVITGDSLGNVLDGSSGADTLNGGDGTDTLLGGTGNDTILASAGNDVIDGGGNTDTVNFSGGPGTSISVTLNGSTDATVTVTGGDNQTVRNVENVIGKAGDDVIVGDTAANVLTGLGGHDQLDGAGGDDTLDGGLGNDTIQGGAGNDRILGDTGADTIDGGANTDTLDYSASGLGAIAVTLNGATQVTLTVAGDSNDLVQNVENVTGGAAGDTLYGDSAANVLSGFNGDDTLWGAGGVDTLDGGDGIDVANYAAAAGLIVVDLGANLASSDGSGASDTLLNIEGVVGTGFADTITGNGSANVLMGGGDNDILRGRGGVDVLNGEGGTSDTADYSFAASGVTASLLAGSASNDGDGATDTLLNIENITGSAFADTLTGDNGANTILGGGASDTLEGRGGVDTLNGGDGFDYADYTNAGNGVVVDLQAQTVGNDGDGASDVLISIEGAFGSGFVDTLTGTSGADLLFGRGGADTLIGGDGNDTLDGGIGNDTFIAGNGADTFDGGSSGIADLLDYTGSATTSISVTLNGASAATVTATGDASDTVLNIEHIIATSGADTIVGDGSANEFQGMAGNDTLGGRGGIDTLDGGADEDFADYQSAAGGVTASIATQSASNDGDGASDVFLNIEHLRGSAFADTLSGSGGTNTLLGNGGNDVLYGAAGNDLLDGGGDSDTANYTNAAGSVTASLAALGASADGDGGTDTFVSIENLTGSAFGDTLTGDVGANTLAGLAGNDLLSAGDGNDVVDAGDNDDSIVAGNGADTFDGGTGVDTINFGGANANSITVTLNGSTNATVTATNDSSDTVRNIENVIGTGGADFITGDSQVNTLAGGAGNDTLGGRAGVDTLDGGADSDFADYLSAAGGVVASLAAQAASNDGDGANDVFVSIENLRGSAQADTLTGSIGDNTILGMNGGDLIDAGSGNDSVDGGAGNDSIVAGSGADTFDGGADTDTIDYRTGPATAISVTLNGATFVTVTATGESNDSIRNIENVMGTTGADTITGDSAANWLNGHDGADLLAGGGGNDSIDGGEGNDTLLAGDGADTFDGGNGVDTLNFSTGSATSVILTLNGALDATATVAGDANDVVRAIENVIGTSGIDAITGDSGNNILMGGNDNDTLGGRGGVDTIDGGDGKDTADYANAGGPVTVSLATLSASNDGDGATDVLVSIEDLRGSFLSDTLSGDGNANTIWGLAGADVISAAGGNDSVDAGAGNDSIIAGNGADVFDGGADVDTLDYSGSAQTSISVTLNGATSATVTVTGDSNDTVRNIENVTGTAGADLIFGDGAVNVLSGGAGNDTLAGGAGADTLNGDGDTDTVTYAAMSSAVTVNLGAGTAANDGTGAVDTLNSIENAIGGTGADTLTGSVGANTLAGGVGADTLAGRGGNDVLDGGAEIDTASYADASGSVTAAIYLGGASNDGDGGVDTFVSIENLTGSGQADILDGDANDNVVNGGGGADTLNGRQGNDTIIGGLGDDTLFASNGIDTFDGGGGNDLLSYATNNAITSATFAGLTGTIVNDGEVDTVTEIERFSLSQNDDLVTFDTLSMTQLTAVEAGLGNDTIRIVDDGIGNDLTDRGLDGAQFATIFSNIEELDFRGTDLTGGDTFDIGNDEIDALASGTSLTIRVDLGTIALTDINPLTQSGATITGDSTVGNVRTVNWSDGTQLIVNGGP